MINRSEIIKKLESAGLSLTNPRITIASFLFNYKHPTAEEVIKFAQKHLPKVNVATIYNVMTDLEKVNLIKKIKFPHLDQLVYDVNTHDHYHFLDTETGELVDVEPEHVKISSTLAKQYQVEGLDILFKGKIKK